MDKTASRHAKAKKRNEISAVMYHTEKTSVNSVK